MKNKELTVKHNTQKRITRKQIHLWSECYDYDRITELVPDAGLTPLEVAALDIPVSIRLCVLLREDVIPARSLRLLACSWAQKACLAANCFDERSMKVIAVARRFARGDATESELASAWSSARVAACHAWSAIRCADSADSADAALRLMGDGRRYGLRLKLLLGRLTRRCGLRRRWMLEPLSWFARSNLMTWYMCLRFIHNFVLFYVGHLSSVPRGTLENGRGWGGPSPSNSPPEGGRNSLKGLNYVRRWALKSTKRR